ncbi:MAG: hypothetical protein ACLGH0_01240 [Thermoanaerobaculia bacterium]
MNVKTINIDWVDGVLTWDVLHLSIEEDFVGEIRWIINPAAPVNFVNPPLKFYKASDEKPFIDKPYFSEKLVSLKWTNTDSDPKAHRKIKYNANLKTPDFGLLPFDPTVQNEPPSD